MSDYILTQIEPYVACMGYFESQEQAIKFAEDIRVTDLCSHYTIGTYTNGKYNETYFSMKKEGV